MHNSRPSLTGTRPPVSVEQRMRCAGILITKIQWNVVYTAVHVSAHSEIKTFVFAIQNEK